MASMKDPLSSRRGADFFERKFFCHILVAVGFGRSALVLDRGQALAVTDFCSTSSEPEAEGDHHPPPFFELGRRGVYAQASIRDHSRREVPFNEIRKTPPFTRTTVPVPDWPSCHASGSSFLGRHVHLVRLNGSCLFVVVACRSIDPIPLDQTAAVRAGRFLVAFGLGLTTSTWAALGS